MTLYIEDDNHVDVNPSPDAKEAVKYTRPLLRFRHNVGDILTIDPRWRFDKAVELMFKHKDFKPNHFGGIDFWGQISVPIICKRGYVGTTATLFAPDGNYLKQVTTHLHPLDQFCKLTGRKVVQQKFIFLLCTDPLFIPDPLGHEILVKLLNNRKTAQPLNW